ncbi:MAG: hypothetical protein A2X64_06965 [Ignavibacteria bacterium GWF2_33_9]|nr:MAG: hypothetical protein A2X64_06965 [Ignavibacteria bacterium GWF2_33_9]
MKKNRLEILIFIFFVAASNLFAQVDDIDSILYEANNRYKLNEMNPEGKEFWLCFMQNYKSENNRTNTLLLELFITSEFDTDVQIEIKALNFRKTERVQAKTVVNVKLPYLAEVKSSEVIEPGMSVHITAEQPISVYGLNRRHQTTDTYLGLPTKVLGKVYRVMSYTMSSPLLPEFAIVATEDNTNVEINPSVITQGGRPANTPFFVTLNKGDVYQVVGKQDFRTNIKVDLTGTFISASKPISVFGGHQCAYVPSPPPVITACNHLVEQIPPLTSWGRHFFVGKLEKRSTYSWRVLANSDSTRLFLNQKFLGYLNAGKWFEDTSSTDIQLKADKPILVAQYSQGFKNGDSIGDPCMILISPTQQFLNKYRFATPVNGDWNHFITVVIPTNAINSMRLNNNRVNKKIFRKIGITRYSIGSIQVPYGTHSIDAEMPFGMYSYGFGYGADAFDAYGTMGGQSFIEYEPANDTLAPMVETFTKTDEMKMIIRDDREDDTGINDVDIMENLGFDVKIPKFSKGVPQLEMNLKNMPGVPGKLVLKITDLALNTKYQSICYQSNPKTGLFEYKINDGIVEECNIDEGWMIGLFAKTNFFFHDADFAESGNMNSSIPIIPRELGKFKQATGSGLSIGLSATHQLWKRLYASGKLNFESINGILQAPDITVSSYRNPETGELFPFQEGRNLTLTGLNTVLDVQIEYYFNSLIYSFAGLNSTFHFSKAIDYSSEILTPNFVEYSKAEKAIIEARYPEKLTSLNSVNFGSELGLGFYYPIRYNLSAYFEMGYNIYFGSLINDGDWNISRLSLLFGFKYRI